jgi:hypothetical protein
MRKLMTIGLLLLTGCQNVAGPFSYRPATRPDDPRYSTAEQKSRVNDQLAIPDDFGNQMPKSGASTPGIYWGGNR